MSSNVEKIKERLNITDVVGSYIKLEKSGSNLKAKCPFHSEKTPSFFVSPDRGSYYCFGCGAKGDIFTFVQEFEGLDFLGSLKILALRAGVPLEKGRHKPSTDKEKMFKIMELAALFFEDKLEDNVEALNYLEKRGIKKNTVKDWRIGLAPNSFEAALTYLKGRGFKEAEMEKVGLVKRSSERQGHFYDTFRGRIIFPIFDSAGRPIAFSGRLLKEEKNAPKYLNSPETPLFNKSETLYGFHKAKTAIREKNYSILVEGQIDLVISHQEGFTNSVASSGTALTLSQLSRLSRLSPRIILSYDGDSAGFKALQKGTKLALSLGMNVRIASMPKDEDPASLITKSKEKYSDLLKNSFHIIDFYLEKILSSRLEERQMDGQVKTKILPFIKILPSHIDQARFIKNVADKTDIKEKALWEDLEKIKFDEQPDFQGKDASREKLGDRRESIAFRILGIILWQESLGNKDFAGEQFRKKLADMAGSQELALIENRKDEAIFEAEAYYSGADDLNKILDDLFFNLEEEVLKNQFADIMKELFLAEKASDKNKAEKLLIECQEISKKINKLNTRKAEVYSKSKLKF